MKIIAVTQARYGSTRLPAKVLKKVGEKSLLTVHLQRILQSKLISKLIVATTSEPGAEKIVEISNEEGVSTYKGSTNDVLDRFYNAVKDEAPDYIVRITSDCPLIDPIVIDQIILKCVNSDYDYVSNTLAPTYPDGIDCECFKFSALEYAYKNAILQSEREHVTPFIKKNSNFYGKDIFKTVNYTYSKDYSAYRITIDTAEDFEVIKYLIEKLGIDKTWEEYIDELNKNPEIKKINSLSKRDEGYQKSLIEDKVINNNHGKRTRTI